MKYLILILLFFFKLNFFAQSNSTDLSIDTTLNSSQVIVESTTDASSGAMLIQNQPINGAPVPQSDWQIILGAGFIYAPIYSGSNIYRQTPIIFPAIKYKDIFSLDFEGIKFNIIRQKIYSIGIAILYSSGRKENSYNWISKETSNELKGMGDLNDAFGSKLYISYNFGVIKFGVDYSKYFDAHNNGSKIGANFSYIKFINRSNIFTSSISFHYDDENQADNYYSVTKEQAQKSKFKEYNASKGINNANLSFFMLHIFNPNWSSTIIFNNTQLLNSAAKSPLTKRILSQSLILAVSYKFL